MEYLDVFNENGEKTGITKLRDEVHRDGDWHKVVFVFVVNDKGEVILQKRSKEKKTSPNMWTSSASGHVSAGDTEVEAAIRELEEEIGIKADEQELEYLLTTKEEYTNQEKKLKVKCIANVYLLMKNIHLEELVLQKEEVSEVKYVYYKQLEKMLGVEKYNIIKQDEIYSKLLEVLHERFDKVNVKNKKEG